MEQQWLEKVNKEIGRNFILPFSAEAILNNEIRSIARTVDPYETAEETIERIMSDGDKESNAYIPR